MNYEEIIEKIEDILEEGKPSFGGGGKIKVDGDAISECLKELSSSIPKENIQARKIVAERREILRAAQENANEIINEAKAKAAEMTEAHEITKAAKDAAFKILSEANEEAAQIVKNANEEAEAREESAKKYAYSMRSTAIDFAKGILSDCDEYITSDIEHYTKSQEHVRLALDNINNILLKKPEEE